MIAADTNLLIYSHRIDSPWHDAARECMRSLAEGREPWAIPWPCLHEFYAVVTHPQIYRPPSTSREAVAQIDAWMTSPRLEILAENDGYWHELRGLVDRGRVVGPIVHDARVAALCLLHGVRELWSADRDFGRFPGLHVRNPLP